MPSFVSQNGWRWLLVSRQMAAAARRVAGEMATTLAVIGEPGDGSRLREVFELWAKPVSQVYHDEVRCMAHGGRLVECEAREAKGCAPTLAVVVYAPQRARPDDMLAR